MNTINTLSIGNIRESTTDNSTDMYKGTSISVSLHAEQLVLRYILGQIPYRFGETRIIFCVSGENQAIVNYTPSCLETGELEINTVGTLYQECEMSSDCRMMGLLISMDMLHEVLGDNIPDLFTNPATSSKMRLNEQDQIVFKHMISALLNLLPVYGEQSPVVTHLLASLLQHISSLINKESQQPVSANRNALIYRKFVHLLAIEQGKRHPLSYYSRQLCISPHYLSVAVSKFCGSTPKSLMDRSVIAEIKAQLRHTDRSIQQIADALHFPSSSFLCKYFKKHEGCTPNEYRVTSAGAAR